MSLFVLLNNTTDIWIVFEGSELYYESQACYVQGLLEQLAGIGCVVWWLCISVNMFFSFILGVKTQIYERYMHIGCWLCCILTVALSDPYIGVASLWCWIDAPKWQLMLYYAPMAASLCIGGGFHIATIYKFLKMSKLRVNKTELPVHILRQIIFVGWFSLLFLFFCIHRLYIYLYNNDICPFYLVVPAMTAEASQGCFVFLIFGLRAEHWAMWRDKFSLYCCSNKRQRYEPIGS